jgi:aldose 1-epimerase
MRFCQQVTNLMHGLQAQTQGALRASTELVGLAAGELRLMLAPEAGGSIASFTHAWTERGRPRELHWLRGADAEGLARRNPLAMASFPLVPFCNRIRSGRATFAGRDIHFPPNHPAADAPHPLHGIGWLRPWQLLSAGPRDAELGLEVAASPAWPWRFSARQRFVLTESALHVTMTLTNEDTAAMPAGIGHHPYFPHEPGTRITLPVDGMWRTDAEVMPTELTRGAPVPSLRAGAEVATLDLDNNFTGWERSATIAWPADRHGPRRQLVMAAEAPLDFFVVYSPAGFDHFCAEPVSQCTDWLNLLPQHGRELLGGAEVAPGDSLTARFSLAPSLF